MSDFKSMTPEREAHLAELKQRFIAAVDAKYRKGQAEHGGNVWERDSLEDSEQEMLDLWVYQSCQRRKIKAIHDIVCKLQECISMGAFIRVEILVDELY